MEFKQEDLDRIRKDLENIEEERHEYVKKATGEERCANCTHYELDKYDPSLSSYRAISSICNESILLGLIVTFMPDDVCNGSFQWKV